MDRTSTSQWADERPTGHPRDGDDAAWATAPGTPSERRVSDVHLPTTRAEEDVPGPSGSVDAWPAVVDLFAEAADDDYTSKLVGSIGLTVRLRPSERRDASLLLRAHGRLEVVENGGGGDRADIELELANPDLVRLSEGRLRVAMAIAGGRATYTGPVRQFLRVLPMVQAIARPPVPVGTNTIHDGVEEIS